MIPYYSCISLGISKVSILEESQMLFAHLDQSVGWKSSAAMCRRTHSLLREGEEEKGHTHSVLREGDGEKGHTHSVLREGDEEKGHTHSLLREGEGEKGHTHSLLREDEEKGHTHSLLREDEEKGHTHSSSRLHWPSPDYWDRDQQARCTHLTRFRSDLYLIIMIIITI